MSHVRGAQRAARVGFSSLTLREARLLERVNRARAAIWRACSGAASPQCADEAARRRAQGGGRGVTALVRERLLQPRRAQVDEHDRCACGGEAGRRAGGWLRGFPALKSFSARAFHGPFLVFLRGASYPFSIASPLQVWYNKFDGSDFEECVNLEVAKGKVTKRILRSKKLATHASPPPPSKAAAASAGVVGGAVAPPTAAARPGAKRGRDAPAAAAAAEDFSSSDDESSDAEEAQRADKRARDLACAADASAAAAAAAAAAAVRAAADAAADRAAADRAATVAGANEAVVQLRRKRDALRSELAALEGAISDATDALRRAREAAAAEGGAAALRIEVAAAA